MLQSWLEGGRGREERVGWGSGTSQPMRSVPLLPMHAVNSLPLEEEEEELIQQIQEAAEVRILSNVCGS